jgi:hypothetical protein
MHFVAPKKASVGDPLAEKLVADFCADWEQHGAAAIAWLRQYVKIAAQLIPKEFVMKAQSINDLSDKQSAKCWRIWLMKWGESTLR